MNNEEDWLVSDETCKGCIYYGYLSRSGRGNRCCDYTYITERIRPGIPKDCTVKMKGRWDVSYNVKAGTIMRQEKE